MNHSTLQYDGVCSTQRQRYFLVPTSRDEDGRTVQVRREVGAEVRDSFFGVDHHMPNWFVTGGR